MTQPPSPALRPSSEHTACPRVRDAAGLDQLVHLDQLMQLDIATAARAHGRSPRGRATERPSR
eukprot:3286267-Prymnesium_polylepis.1